MGVLVLSRYKDEVIHIGDDIRVIVVEVRGYKVRLGIEAPKHIPVHRAEIYQRLRGEDNGDEPIRDA